MHGRLLGVPMGEVGITDHNMLTLRIKHESLIIHKHPIHEEVRTGADWEWWLDTPQGWLCLVFQAKILDQNGRYAGITKRNAADKLQAETLLESCKRRSRRLGGPVWPFYCLYNSWTGPWPQDVPKHDGLDPSLMTLEELQLYGCAAADAWSVLQVLRDPDYSNRRTLRDTYLPYCRPWSLIFPDPEDPPADETAAITNMLASWMPGYRAQLPRGTDRVHEPDSEDSGLNSPDASRQDHVEIRRNPALIQHPPPYVLDLVISMFRVVLSEHVEEGWRHLA